MKTEIKVAALLAAILAMTPSCSNSGKDDGDGDTGDGDGDAATGGGTGDGDGDTGSGGGDGDGDGDLAKEFEACAVEAAEAEALPADIIFMIDQSISMVQHTVPDNTEGAPTRWKVLRDAVLEFIDNEGTAGLRMGLQFFPQPGTAPLPNNGGPSGTSCDVADYSVPEVEIDILPDNAAALTAAYPEAPAGTFTPSHPSLEGALTYARQWGSRPENAGRGVAVVWVTDGYPTVCDDRTIAGLATLAREYNNPEGGEVRVPTFVVGLGPTPNLSQVARAGGTGDGFFVADDAGEGAVDDLLASLLRVANSPALCEFSFPVSSDGSALDPTKVNMQFTPVGGAPEPVGQTTGPSACATNPGWYYGPPSGGIGAGGASGDGDTQAIHVCPQVCGNFGGGSVSIVVGCETINIF